MERVIKSGAGWRIGWNPAAVEYQGLVGTDDWAIELTAAEFSDFCRLAGQLVQSVHQLTAELMDEEKISCEAESDLLWIEVSGYAHAYSLRFVLNTRRCAEGSWTPEAVSDFIQAAQTLPF